MEDIDIEDFKIEDHSDIKWEQDDVESFLNNAKELALNDGSDDPLFLNDIINDSQDQKGENSEGKISNISVQQKSNLAKEYQCIECKYSTDEKAALKKHIESIHKKIVRFACNQCDYKHYYKHIVKSHLKFNHKETISQNRILRIGCKKCEEGEDHQMCSSKYKNPEEHPYICTEDGCTFSSKFRQFLKKHIESVHRGLVRYSCNNCDLKRYYKHNIQIHQKTKHPFSENRVITIGCEACDKGDEHPECFVIKIESKFKQESKCLVENCSFVAGSKRRLQRHMKIHHPDYEKSLVKTDIYIKAEDEMKWEEEDIKKPIVADMKLFKVKKKLKVKDSVKKTKYKKSKEDKTTSILCPLCGITCKNQFNLFTHHEIVHENKFNYQCNICNYQCYFSTGMEKHHSSMHKTEDCKLIQVHCKGCKSKVEHSDCKRLKKLENIRRRRGLEPKEKVKVAKKKKEKTCDICNIRLESESMRPEHYKMLHPTVKLFNCDKCLYGSNYKYNFQNHVKANHNENLYICHLCEFKTEMATLFNSHMRNCHSVQKTVDKSRKQYQCDYCDYSTPYKSNLNEHVNRAHIGSKYQCSKCDFSTKSKQYFKLHEDVKHNGKTFDCHLCSHKATTKSNLKVHQELKHSNIMYNCIELNCDFKCKSKQYFQQHVTSHNNNKSLT